jgi:geranylgeranyl diphosphate synthase, type II
MRQEDRVVHVHPALGDRRDRRLGRPARERDTFGFGWLLGLLYQIVNDLDGGSAPRGDTDIDEGKRTILLIHLLDALSGEDSKRLVDVMGMPRAKCRREVKWVLALMDDAGSIGYARSCVLDLAHAARDEADEAFGSLPPSDARDLLLSATGLVLEQCGFQRSSAAAAASG